MYYPLLFLYKPSSLRAICLCIYSEEGAWEVSLAGAQAALGHIPLLFKAATVGKCGLNRRVQGLPCRGLGCPQKPLIFSFAAAVGKCGLNRRVQGLPCRGLGCPQKPLIFSFAAAVGKTRVPE